VTRRFTLITTPSALIFTLALILRLAHVVWTAESADSALSNAEIQRHVRYLASDELMGRGVDIPGIELARDYVAREFKQYGLVPGGDKGTYFQELEVVTGVKIKEPTAAILSENAPLAVERDWTPFGASRSGEAEGEIVFVGYGITAQGYDYDDYAGVDVSGKIALVLRYEPPPLRDKSPFQKLPRYSRYSALNEKMTNARNHGAIAMILVDPNPTPAGQKELISLRRSMGRNDSGLIALQIKREIIEKWLAHSNISLVALKEKIDRDEKPASVALSKLRASFRVALERITKKTDNVIGILPGSDPALKEQNIVIGAHYDHIGLGYFGTHDSSTEGQIHNGADDNASGTAVLMDLAQRLSRSSHRPPRTIVFAAFTGEELGIRGSRYYVEHPPFPLRTTVAMLNMDMVGRMKDGQITVSGVDTAKEFSAWVSQAGKETGLEVKFPSGRTGSSDHASFQRKEIPALHFYTGIHEDYHRPTDDWEKLNMEGMMKVSDLVLNVAQRIAASKESLNFVRTQPATSPSQSSPTSHPPARYP
jgi:Peptidase family M28/PA domain